MRTIRNLTLLSMFLVASLLFSGCKKDDSSKPIPKKDGGKTTEVTPEKPVPAGVNESDLQLVSLSVPKMV